MVVVMLQGKRILVTGGCCFFRSRLGWPVLRGWEGVVIQGIFLGWFCPS